MYLVPDETDKSGGEKRHSFVHRFRCCVMAKTNTKRTGQGLSPCFPPDVDGKVAFAVPTLVDTSMFVYIFTITLTSSLSTRLLLVSSMSSHD
jgi:hypothetical protein